MRTKLSPAEREARRAARSRFSFSDAAYKHYDPWADGFGGPEQWRDAAERLAGGRGAFHATDQLNAMDRARLELLGLSGFPATASELKTAFRRACFAAHPDHGGSAAAFTAVYQAFERLTIHYPETR